MFRRRRAQAEPDAAEPTIAGDRLGTTEPDGSSDGAAKPAGEWTSVVVQGPTFTIDLVVARLESEGIEVDRPATAGLSPAHGGSPQGQRLGYRVVDEPAVHAALRNAELA